MRFFDAFFDFLVILVLNTGGGTVTGYGLAAAQLARLKSAGLKLTVIVEQVAASGGSAARKGEMRASAIAFHSRPEDLGEKRGVQCTWF